MSDVDAALHLHRGRNIDPGQLSEIMHYTLVVGGNLRFLRSVNVWRFAAVHQAVQATERPWANEGLASRGAGQEQ